MKKQHTFLGAVILTLTAVLAFGVLLTGCPVPLNSPEETEALDEIDGSISYENYIRLSITLPPDQTESRSRSYDREQTKSAINYYELIVQKLKDSSGMPVSKTPDIYVSASGPKGGSLAVPVEIDCVYNVLLLGGYLPENNLEPILLGSAFAESEKIRAGKNLVKMNMQWVDTDPSNWRFLLQAGETDDTSPWKPGRVSAAPNLMVLDLPRRNDPTVTIQDPSYARIRIGGLGPLIEAQAGSKGASAITTPGSFFAVEPWIDLGVYVTSNYPALPTPWAKKKTGVVVSNTGSLVAIQWLFKPEDLPDANDVKKGNYDAKLTFEARYYGFSEKPVEEKPTAGFLRWRIQNGFDYNEWDFAGYPGGAVFVRTGKGSGSLPGYGDNTLGVLRSPELALSGGFKSIAYRITDSRPTAKNYDVYIKAGLNQTVENVVQPTNKISALTGITPSATGMSGTIDFALPATPVTIGAFEHYSLVVVANFDYLEGYPYPDAKSDVFQVHTGNIPITYADGTTGTLIWDGVSDGTNVGRLYSVEGGAKGKTIWKGGYLNSTNAAQTAYFGRTDSGQTSIRLYFGGTGGVLAPRGTGTQAAPYLAGTWSELAASSTLLISGKFLKQEVDINMLGAGFDLNTEWQNSTALAGTFDGNGKTLANLELKSAAGGLFDSIAATGVVMNVTLVSSTIGINERLGATTTTSPLGGIAGTNAGTIWRCKIDSYSTVTTGGAIVGGIAGKNTKDILYCYNQAAVSCTKTAVAANEGKGGIAGQIETAGRVIGCKNEGSVTAATSDVGGIVGQALAGATNVITACYNVGTVKNTVTGAANGGTGGILGGRFNTTGVCAITASYSAGRVEQGGATSLMAYGVGDNAGTGTHTSSFFWDFPDDNATGFFNDAGASWKFSNAVWPDTTSLTVQYPIVGTYTTSYIGNAAWGTGAATDHTGPTVITGNVDTANKYWKTLGNKGDNPGVGNLPKLWWE